MLENSPEDREDSTEVVVESLIPESGGTSVSFRPGTARFLPDFERKPWWIAPSAIVAVPLFVMLLAAWAIPERIGSNIEEVSRETSQNARTRGDRESPSRRERTTSEPPEREEESEEIEDGEEEARKKPARASRSSRRASKESPRRGFSPVREREYTPPPPPPPVSAPEPSPEPDVPAMANAPRGGEVLRIVQPQEAAPPPAQEAAVEPAAAEEATPAAPVEAPAEPPSE